MDPFTQKLLERTRARRENLAKKMAENQTSPPRQKVPLAPNTSENTEKCLPKKPTHTSMDVGKTDASASSSMKSRLQLISRQRAHWDKDGSDTESSPVLPGTSSRQTASAWSLSTSSTPVAKTTKARFAALAANINSWEDDLSHPTIQEEEEKPVKKWKRPAPQPEDQAPPQNITHTSATQRLKPVDHKTIEKAEPASSTSSHKKVNMIKQRSPIKGSIDQPIPAKRNLTGDRTKETESAPIRQPASREMSRQQLGNSRMGEVPFHRASSKPANTGQVERQVCEEVVKKSEVSHTAKVAHIKSATPTAKVAHIKLATPTKSVSMQDKKESPQKRPSETPRGVASKKQAVTVVQPIGKEMLLSPTQVEPRIGAMAQSIHDRLKAHQDKWQCSEINKKTQADRQKEMAILRGRWDYPHGEATKQRSGTPEKTTTVREEPKPTTQFKDTEDESMEDDEEEDEGESYNMTDIDEDLSSNQGSANNSVDNKTKKDEVDGEPNEENMDESVNLTDVLSDIDLLITEAEHAMKEEEKGKELPIVPAATSTPKEDNTKIVPMVASTEQSTPQAPPRQKHPAPQKRLHEEQRNLYDVQSYRSQTRDSVVIDKKIVREEEIRNTRKMEQRTPRSAPRKSSNREKIKMLMEEVSAQQSIIHQTSQALSLIASNENFRNTQEEIEAEKMLVIATQKRLACLTEIQYLKNSPAEDVMYTEDGEEIAACKGAVTIKDIRLPFKTEYILHQESTPDSPSHYYFIIFRCGANVTTSQLLNTNDDLSGDCLKYSNMIALNDLDSDFTVEVNVYQMRSTTAKIEGLAQKSHSIKQGRFGNLTPKKFLSNKGKNDRGGAGPAVSGSRSSTFAPVGSVKLSLASCQSSKFILSRVPFTSPLEGSIHLCMTCRKNSSIVERGFLTMFDDISGFGSWHRRWCVLAEGHISYWKYPDDEKHKHPIGSIDLRECITKEVALISRILCARPNTFELVNVRPAARNEKETLVTKRCNSLLTTKYMISADTKEDRFHWIDALNKTLTDLRMWNKDASYPSQG